MNALRHAPLVGRRALAVLAALALVVGIALVFSGTLTRSTDVGAQAAQAQAVVAELEARREAGERELEFVRTEAFVRWQARIEGLGQEGERPFALEPGAPAPEPITPIGPQDDAPRALPPLEAWMELLFGS